MPGKVCIFYVTVNDSDAYDNGDIQNNWYMIQRYT